MPQDPSSPQGTLLAISPDYAVSEWLDDNDSRSESNEKAIARGSFHGLGVTYLMEGGTGRVRARLEPCDLNAAGTHLRGGKRVLFLLFSLFGLDLQRGPMRNLWCLDAKDSNGLLSAGLAGYPAAQAAKRLKQSMQTRTEQQAPEPAQPVEPAEPEGIAQAPTTRLDAVPPASLQVVLSLLPSNGSNLRAVSRGIGEAVHEQHRWKVLKSRVKSVSTPKDVGAVLEDLGLASTGTPLSVLKGERTREAEVLAALASRTKTSYWRAHAESVGEPLLRAIMALPTPARHAPLRLWLQAQCNEPDPADARGRWSQLYRQLPARDKAKLCVGILPQYGYQSVHHAAALGIDDRERWLDIARELNNDELKAFAGAVVESWRLGSESEDVFLERVLEIVEVSSALGPARLSAVIAGILTYARQILTLAPPGVAPVLVEDSVVQDDTVWRRLLAAVPAREALGPLLECASQAAMMLWVDPHGVGALMAPEVKRLLDRVSGEAPDALTDAQRSEILMKLHRCPDVDITPHWFTLIEYCERPKTPSADVRRLAYALCAALPRVTDRSAVHRLLALCQSPRLSLVMQAKLLSNLEQNQPAESPWFQCKERFDAALDVARRDGPLEALYSVLLALPPEHFERALDIVRERGKAAMVQMLSHLIINDRGKLRAATLFGRLSLPDRLDYIRHRFVPPSFITGLLVLQRTTQLAPNTAAELFNAVTLNCIRFSAQPYDMARALLSFVTPLLDMHERYPALVADPRYWARILYLLERSQRHWLDSFWAILELRGATWNRLKTCAPALEGEVHSALAAQMERERP